MDRYTDYDTSTTPETYSPGTGPSSELDLLAEQAEDRAEMGVTPSSNICGNIENEDY